MKTLARILVGLFLCAAAACNRDATAPGEPLGPLPPAPAPQALAFPLRNTIAYVSYRYDPKGDVFLVGSDGRKTRVSGGTTRDQCPAIAPDGSALAYGSDGIVLLRVAGKLVLAGECPTWSADGSKLYAFRRSGHDAIGARIYSRDGQPIATIAGGGISGAISPDEKYYARRFADCPIKGPCQLSVRISPLQNFVPVSTTLVGEGRGELSFSPDGKHLSYECGQLPAVCVADVATLAVRRIEGASHPIWSPLSNTLAYVCGTFVCTSSPDGTGRRLPAHASAVTWSADGGSLLIKWGDANTDLHVVNAVDGSNARNITRDRGHDDLGSWAPFTGPTSGAGFGVPPSLASAQAVLSQNEMIFESPFEDRRIWAIRRSGTGRRRLFNAELDERCTSLSPDRRFVAFESLGLWVSAVDGSVEQQLRDSPIAYVEQFGCPAWSPDGTRLAWLTGSQATGMRLWTARIDGSETRVLAEAPYLNQIVWDADSRSIFYWLWEAPARTFLDGTTEPFPWGFLFSVRADGTLLVRCNGEICVIDRSGGIERNLGPGHSAGWSPDGSHLMFIRFIDGAAPYNAVMIAKTDGSDLRELARNASAKWAPSSDAVALIRFPPREIAIMRLDGTLESQFDASEVWRPTW